MSPYGLFIFFRPHYDRTSGDDICEEKTPFIIECDRSTAGLCPIEQGIRWRAAGAGPTYAADLASVNVTKSEHYMASPLTTHHRQPVTHTVTLQPNTIGPWGLAALAIGITSPAMGLFALWGPIQTATGPITPLIFLAAMLLTLPTAISYSLLNAQMPSAGAACTWLWRSAGPFFGLLAGLLMTSYFLMAAIAQPLMFALFFRDLLQSLQVSLTTMPTLLIGIIVASAPTAWICLRGAESSIRSTVFLMIVESLVVVALSATILFVKSSDPGAVTLSAFDPREATQGVTGFWSAMILGVLAFCGFDVVSSAAEEARAPRKHVPKAILFTIVGISLFWAFNAWVFTLSTPVEQVKEYTNDGLTAVTLVAHTYWGWGNLAIILTAFTGLTAVYISSVQGCSRIIFALARSGFLPAKLSHLSGERRIPRKAILFVLVTTVALDALTLYLLQNGLDGFTWWANALVFFAALTFLTVNAANFLYFRRRNCGDFHWFLNVVIPFTGVILNAYLIYAAFFSALWSSGLRTGRSVVVASLVLLAVEVVAVLIVRYRRSALLASQTPWDACDVHEPPCPPVESHPLHAR